LGVPNCGADLGETFGQQVEGVLPRDHVELAGAAFAAGFAQQRLREARRRHLLHDA
jgi:hypothetical protein